MSERVAASTDSEAELAVEQPRLAAASGRSEAEPAVKRPKQRGRLTGGCASDPGLRSGGAHRLRDEVPAGWGLVAAAKKQRRPHDPWDAT